MADINITYDLLFDVLRYEKSREDIQVLDKNFFKHCIEYIKTKEEVLIHSNTPPTERELTKIQIGNIRKILVELFDRRQKKIINMAIYRVKTNNDIVMADNMLDEEKIFFENQFNLLQRYKENVTDNVLYGKDTTGIALNNSVGTIVSSKENLTVDFESIKSVRFIKPVPRFLGPSMERYGPFEEDDVASLPGMIADILIKKSRAEEIKVS